MANSPKHKAENGALRIENAWLREIVLDWCYADLDNMSGLEHRRELTRVMARNMGLLPTASKGKKNEPVRD
ncbi:hypothetical protein LCGC14_1416510 [marine sediment metagenome]|uniref:Uncharacterized protein n=1 Tax=marine sediment metagenome TaxID=412755 RepID=A0A0F9M863_9ZZZZ